MRDPRVAAGGRPRSCVRCARPPAGTAALEGFLGRPFDATRAPFPFDEEDQMTLRHAVIAMVAGMAVGSMALPARALVVCKKKSGAVFLRDACKKKETVV